MQILDFLSVDNIKMNLESKSKKDAIRELVDVLVKSGKIKDKKKMVQILMEREELGSTGIFFLLVAPEGAAGAHLKALARISSLLKDKYFRKSLLSAKTPEEVIKIIQEEEKLKH